MDKVKIRKACSSSGRHGCLIVTSSANLFSVILWILSSLGNQGGHQQLCSWSPLPPSLPEFTAIQARLQVPKGEIPMCHGKLCSGLSLASGTGWNSLCFSPAPDLEMIMSSKLGDAIGLCYLLHCPGIWKLRQRLPLWHCTWVLRSLLAAVLHWGAFSSVSLSTALSLEKSVLKDQILVSDQLLHVRNRYRLRALPSF